MTQSVLCDLFINNCVKITNKFHFHLMNGEMGSKYRSEVKLWKGELKKRRTTRSAGLPRGICWWCYLPLFDLILILNALLLMLNTLACLFFIIPIVPVNGSQFLNQLWDIFWFTDFMSGSACCVDWHDAECVRAYTWTQDTTCHPSCLWS